MIIYIIILCIVYFLFLFAKNIKRKECKEEFNQKCIFIINQNCFQDERSNVLYQFMATKSHVKLLKKIESLGYSPEILIYTKPSKFNEEFEYWYKPYKVKIIEKELNPDDFKENVIITKCSKEFEDPFIENFVFNGEKMILD